MKTPPPNQIQPITIAAVRMEIRGFSSPYPVITVRGQRQPEYHFFRCPETGIFRRCYVGRESKAEHEFALADAREAMSDIQAGPQGPSHRVTILLVTAEEFAEAEASAEQRVAEAVENERLRCEQEKAAREEAARLQQEADDLASGVKEPEKATPPATKKGAGRKALEGIERTVGATTQQEAA